MNLRVQEYLKQDRQWPRWLRVAHAKYQLSIANTEADRVFWRQIRRANSNFDEGKDANVRKGPS